jgi:uncharacterized protein with HEPN domain
MPRDEVYLVYMLLATRRIMRSSDGVERQEFDQNPEKKDSVVLQLGNLGEAARRLSQAFRDAHPEIPWRDIVGMRHRLFHGYEEIDWNTVWTAATVEVPELVRKLEPLVPPDEA